MGMEMGMSWDGPENFVLSHWIPGYTAGAVTASILLCSIVFLNMSPLLPLLSQCPLCLCLVSGCLDALRLLIQVT